jgi:hypothetical protein
MRDGREKREGEGRKGRRGGEGGREGEGVGERMGCFCFCHVVAIFSIFFPFFFALGEGMRVGIFCTVHFYAFENLGHVSSPFIMEMKIYWLPCSHNTEMEILVTWCHTHKKHYIHTHIYTMA